MLARLRPLYLVASASAALLAACGGDEPARPAGVIEGPFALVMGTRTSLMTLARDKARVTCAAKPGLKQFDVEAAGESPEDEGKFFRLSLKSYTGPRDYEIEYSAGGVEHRVDVGFPSGAAKKYSYKFFQFLRTDLNITYRSHCDISITADELPDRTRYTGTLSCGALWADFDSLDYLSQPLNGFADLVAKFECEQAS